MTGTRRAEGRFTAAGVSLAAWAAVVLFGAALVRGLAAFGAVETRDLYLLFLPLALAALLLTAPRLRRVSGWTPRVGLAVVGLVLLSAVVLLPTFRAQGFVALGAGWLALWLAYEIYSSGSRAARFLPVLLIAVGAVEAAYGLLQALAGMARTGAAVRPLDAIATGTLVNRNHFAAMLVMTLALALGVVVASASRRQRLERGEAAARLWVSILGCALMGLAVLLSRSRGGVVSLVLVIVFVGALQLLGRRSAAARSARGLPVSVLLAVILSLGAAVGLDALAQRFLQLSPEHTRLGIYRDTVAMVGDQPLTGVGPGLFQWRFRPYQTADTGHLYEHAHSDVLQSAAEWGVPLALLFWGFVVLRALLSARTFLRAEEAEARGTALGCSAALVAVLFHSLFEFSLQVPTNLVLLGAILGIGWANDAPPPALGLPEPRRTAGRRLLSLVLVALVTAAGWCVSRRWWAELESLESGDLGGVTRASRLDPQQPRYQLRLGLAYRDMPGFRNLEAAGVHLERAVALNPHNAHYRRELAKLQELAGNLKGAEASLRAAAELNPHSAATRWRLGNLHLRAGAMAQARTELAAALERDPKLYAPALRLVLKATRDFAELDEIWPRERAARLALLELLCDSSSPGSEPPPVEFLLAQLSGLLEGEPPPSIAVGSLAVRHLVERGEATAAVEAWLALTAAHHLEDPEFRGGASAVWNGGFELPLSAGALDWVGTSGPGYSSARQEDEAHEGRFALRVDFDGSENLDFHRLLQELVVERGREYDLEVSLKSEELSTEQEVFVEIRSQPDWKLLLATEAIGGTTPWRQLGGSFEVPDDSRSIVFRLRREPSRRIDGRMSGRLWIDGVSVKGR